MTIAFFSPQKAYAQTDAECFTEYQKREYKCLQEYNKCIYSCNDINTYKSCETACSSQDKTCSDQASADLTACKAAISKGKEDVPFQAESGQDCRKIFDKESYKCLKVSGDCQRECSEETKRPDGGTYFNSGEIYSKCTKASDCDGKGKACNEQALANFRACGKSDKESAEAKKETSKQDKNPIIQAVNNWLVNDTVTVAESGGSPLRLELSVMLETSTGKNLEESLSRQPVITKESEQKVWGSLANFTSSAQNDIIVVKGKIKVKNPTIDDFIQVMPAEKPVSVTYLDAVITAADSEPTQVGYPWGPDAGAVISFPQNTEIELGATTRNLKLNRGEVEVKIQNNNPQNPFKVHSGSFTVVAPRTHFWVSQSEDKKIAVIGVYEGEVEVKTNDGKTVKVSPDGDKPGVAVVSKKLSPVKLILAGLVLVAVIGGTFLVVRRKFSSKVFSKKKK